MTGLFNRRHFLARLEQRLDAASDDVLLLIDADHFKRINDDFGHHKGDEALHIIADILRNIDDGNHVAGRIGGEEFALIIRNKGLQQASIIAEMIRQRIESAQFEGITAIPHRLTVSIGMGRLKEVDREHPFRKVDAALYTAKHNGRNRVAIYNPSQHKRRTSQSAAGSPIAAE